MTGMKQSAIGETINGNNRLFGSTVGWSNAYVGVSGTRSRSAKHLALPF